MKILYPSLVILLFLLAIPSAAQSRSLIGTFIWDNYSQGDKIIWNIDSFSYNQTYLAPCSDVNTNCTYFDANVGDKIELVFTQDLNESINLATSSSFIGPLYTGVDIMVGGVSYDPYEIFSFPLFIDTEVIISSPDSGMIGGGFGIWLILPTFINETNGGTYFNWLYGSSDYLTTVGGYQTATEVGMNFTSKETTLRYSFDKETGVAKQLELIQPSELSYKITLESANLANFNSNNTIGTNTNTNTNTDTNNSDTLGLPFNFNVALIAFIPIAVYGKFKRRYKSSANSPIH